MTYIVAFISINYEFALELFHLKIILDKYFVNYIFCIFKYRTSYKKKLALTCYRIRLQTY